MPLPCPFCRNAVAPARDAAGLLVCPLCQNTGRPVPQAPAARVCPHCRQQVVPTRNAQGGLVCPACHNTGRPAHVGFAPAPPAAATPFSQLPLEPAHGPRGPASLMLSIGAFAAWILGIVLAITVHPAVGGLVILASLGLAIVGVVLGHGARNAGRRLGDARERRYGTAGLAVGWAWIGLVVAAIVVATAFAALGDGTVAEDSVSMEARESYSQGFEVLDDSVRVTYTIEVTRGIVLAALGPVEDAHSSLKSTGPPMAQTVTEAGDPTKSSTVLAKGHYMLGLHCAGPEPCEARYTIALAD